MDISFERIEGVHFILGAVYGSSTFKTVSVFSIFGLVWQTEVVTSSSCVVVMTACYEPWVAHQKMKKGVSINSLKEIGQHAEVKRITSAGFAADYLYIVISNSNWTEWSTIQGVIARVISKSSER